MGFITELLGGSGTSILTALFALAMVLVMIVAGVWLLKLFFRASSNIGRGRNRRLTLVDTMNVDQKRQLLIVRRDNVEHLILTGGPQDVVVETGIPVEKPVAPVRRPVPVPPKAGIQPIRPAQTVIEDTSVEVMAAPSAPPSATPGAAPRTTVQRLRDLTRPAGQRATGKSLRHTGLMRPVTREKADHSFGDSATSAPVEPRGQGKRDDGNFGAYRSDLKTDGT
jgi:flagellar biogenesis protein FliO